MLVASFNNHAEIHSLGTHFADQKISKFMHWTIAILHSVAARGFLALRETASAQEFIIASYHARNTKEAAAKRRSAPAPPRHRAQPAGNTRLCEILNIRFRETAGNDCFIMHGGCVKWSIWMARTQTHPFSHNSAIKIILGATRTYAVY